MFRAVQHETHKEVIENFRKEQIRKNERRAKKIKNMLKYAGLDTGASMMGSESVLISEVDSDDEDEDTNESKNSESSSESEENDDDSSESNDESNEHD